MNIFKSKKVLMSILIVFLIVLISIGLFICFNNVNKKTFTNNNKEYLLSLLV